MTIGAFHSSLFRRRPFYLSLLLLPAGGIILLAIVPVYLVIIGLPVRKPVLISLRNVVDFPVWFSFFISPVVISVEHVIISLTGLVPVFISLWLVIGFTVRASVLISLVVIIISGKH